MPVVDFHIHMAYYHSYTPGFVEFLMRQRGETPEEMVAKYGTPEKLLAFLDGSGVDFAVLLAEMSPITTGVIDSDYVAAFCRGSRRLIPFASVNPRTAPDPVKELRRAVTVLGCRGLKLYPTYQMFYPNDPMLYPLYAACRELGIPVMLHTGSSVFPGSRLKYADPLFLDDVAVDFPDLTIVMAHCGRPFWYDRAFALARLHPNVYLDVGGLPPQKLPIYFPEFERLADKWLFGSDWPGVPDIRKNIETIRGLPWSEATKQKLLYENAARLLRLT